MNFDGIFALFTLVFISMFQGFVVAIPSDDQISLSHSVTKVAIREMEEADFSVSKKEMEQTENSFRHLQQYLPYCSDIAIALGCVNMKTGKECSFDYSPWFSNNQCIRHLKFTIAVTNEGDTNAKIQSLSSQENGQIKNYTKLFHQGFQLKPGLKILISRTEFYDFCEEDIVGTSAEVLAGIIGDSLSTCAKHDVYMVK